MKSSTLSGLLGIRQRLLCPAEALATPKPLRPRLHCLRDNAAPRPTSNTGRWGGLEVPLFPGPESNSSPLTAFQKGLSTSPREHGSISDSRRAAAGLRAPSALERTRDLWCDATSRPTRRPGDGTLRAPPPAPPGRAATAGSPARPGPAPPRQRPLTPQRRHRFPSGGRRPSPFLPA